MKPLALDLCCGIWEGGWANGLVKAGWQVIGVDIEDQGGYVGHKILADVREIAKDPQKWFPALKFDLVVASPPCQEFSYSALPFVKARTKFTVENPPDPSIWNACVEIARKLGVPLILENVRGAKKWMGKNTWHYGSYYFWGELPALIPIGCPRKGFGKTKDGQYEDRGKQGPLNLKRAHGFGWNKPEVQDARKAARPKNFMPGEYERKRPINLQDDDWEKEPRIFRQNGNPTKYSRRNESKSPFATPSERVNRMREENPVGFTDAYGFSKVNKMRGPEMSAQCDQYKPMVGSEKYQLRGPNGTMMSGRGSAAQPYSLRKRWSAKVAMIPEELSAWIGECYYPRELRNVKS